MARLYANNCSSTLAGSISDSATSLTLATGDGAKFPSPSGGDYFDFTLEQGTTREIARCTARSGDVLTITRAVEAIAGVGAVAQAFTAGATVAIRTTAASLTGAGGSAVFTSGRLPLIGLSARFASGNNGTGFQTIGATATAAGTETARALAATSALTARLRNARVSAASTNATARLTFATAYYNTATASRSEGFAMWTGFCISDAVFSADALLFVGMHSFNSDIGSLSTSDEFVGLYAAPGAANLAIVSNSGGSPITSVDLGSNFPCNTTNTDWYEFALWKAAGVNTWNYELRNATSGLSTSGTVTTDVPDLDGLLHCHINRNTGVGTAAVGFDYTAFACTRPFGIA